MARFALATLRSLIALQWSMPQPTIYNMNNPINGIFIIMVDSVGCVTLWYGMAWRGVACVVVGEGGAWRGGRRAPRQDSPRLGTMLSSSTLCCSSDRQPPRPTIGPTKNIPGPPVSCFRFVICMHQINECSVQCDQMRLPHRAALSSSGAMPGNESRYLGAATHIDEP